MSFLYVRVYHGPCNTFHNVKHKPQMLYGFRHHLQRLGYRVDLVPVDTVNYCMIEMCDQEIFRCNIKNLKFNTCFERDIVSQNAVEAVIEATVKFQRVRTYLWIWHLIEHQLFRRSKYGPKDYWCDQIKIEPPNFEIKGLNDVGDDVNLIKLVEV